MKLLGVEQLHSQQWHRVLINTQTVGEAETQANMQLQNLQATGGTLETLPKDSSVAKCLITAVLCHDANAPYTWQTDSDIQSPVCSVKYSNVIIDFTLYASGDFSSQSEAGKMFL